MQPSDEELVLACRRGDEHAWEQLVERFQRLVFAVPRRAGLDQEAAADVFQRVFVKLLEHIDRIEQPARIGAWLVTTARRETWQTGKRERAAAGSVSLDADKDEPAVVVVDDGPAPDEWLLRLEEQHTVRAAIASLGERCRALLMLLFYVPEPPTYAEIAATLGIREGSIGPTRARCLQKLLETLDAQGFA
jgi:RNA polymerase sigma factor (sigma-70 family)